MKTFLLSFLSLCFLCFATIVFASDVQTKIANNIDSIRSNPIPDNLRNDFNSSYSTGLPSNITTVGEAYDAWYLSDGVEWPLSVYAEGLIDDPDTLGAQGNCSYNGVGDVWDALAWCLSGTQLVQSGDFRVEWDFKNKINSWTRAIAWILWLLAVGAIVYGALLMTISGGEDEKIKKWKDVVKWSIIGFIAVVTASALISVVVNFIFAVAS